MAAPASQKTVTPQTITGEAGLVLIQQRALEMGYLFHPRRIDHGIDGHLDLVDARTMALLNLTILVQSKASENPFPSEDDHEFHYLCRPQDLNLWLAGNAPVLLIFSHPSAGEAWWVDVKAAFPTPQSRASRRIDVDKKTQRFDRDAAAALLDLGKPQGQGLYLRPPPKPEALQSNLLPIQGMPSTIYVAKSAAATYPEAGALLEGARTRDVWILRDGNILSFRDLREPPLDVLTASPVELHRTEEWAQTIDSDLEWIFTDLLTRTIQGSYPELRWDKDRKHMHFQASRDLSPRKISSGSGNRRRTVFTGHGDNGKGKPGYYSHASLKLRMRRFGGRWYAQLEPDYCFTSDGRSEHRNVDLLRAGIKRLDKHAAVKGWVRMWALFLQGADDLFSADLPIKFGPLLSFDVDEGIDDLHWGPMPEDFGRDSEETDDGSTSGADSDDEATMYDDDLLTLLVDDPDDDEAAGAMPHQATTADARKDMPRRPRRATRPADHAG